MTIGNNLNNESPIHPNPINFNLKHLIYYIWHQQSGNQNKKKLEQVFVRCTAN